MSEQQSEREALSEVKLIELAALRVGMKSLLNHGAASCVYSEGCAGVSQEHLIAFAREVALHCVAALSKPSTEQGWTHEINQELERQYLKGFQAGKAFAVSEQGWRTIESAPMHQVVLVAVQGGHVSIGSRAPGIGWFWEPTDEESDDSCVTHWMPLPPPPIEPRKDVG